MYLVGGYSCVYLCFWDAFIIYIVTSIQDDPQAFLFRVIEPIYGINILENRIKRNVMTKKNSIGQGNVTKLLGINVKSAGMNLCQINITSYNI